MIRVLSFVLLLAPAILRAADQPQNAVPPSLNLAVTIADHTSHIQFRVSSAQGNYHDMWQLKFEELLTFCDCNGDGGLDESESRRLPSALALRELASSGFAPLIGRPPKWERLDADQDGTVTLAEIADYYGSEGLGTISLGIGVAPFSNELSTALLQQLDTNGDDQLSIVELQQADAILRKLDQNDDELIGAGELVTDIFYPGAAGNVLLRTSSNDRTTLPDFLANYPLANVDPRTPLAKGATVLNVQLEIHESKEQASDSTVLIQSPSNSDQPAGIHLLTLDRTWISLRADRMSEQSLQTPFRDDYLARFNEADTNANDTLDEAEWSHAEKGLGEVTAELLDRDQDQSITRAELDAWLELQADLAMGQVLLTAIDCGNGLFELLDSDRNGALSVRELRNATSRLKAAKCLEGDIVHLNKLPRQILLTVSQGRPSSALGAYQHSGPEWFLAMDRNADGDLSPREFLGSAATFERLDADHDRLISSSEAMVSP